MGSYGYRYYQRHRRYRYSYTGTYYQQHCIPTLLAFDWLAIQAILTQITYNLDYIWAVVGLARLNLHQS